MVGYIVRESHVEIQGLIYRVKCAGFNGHILLYTTLSTPSFDSLSQYQSGSHYKPSFLGIQETIKGENLHNKRNV